MYTLPISNLSDQEIIEKIKFFPDACNDCIEELHKRHGGIISSVYNNYHSVMSSSGVNQLQTGVKFGDAKRIIWQAAKTYDPDKNSKYSTWLYNTIRFTCLNAIKDAHKEIAYDPDVLHSKMEIVEDSQLQEIDDQLIDKLQEVIDKVTNEKEKQIMKMRYFPDGLNKYTWKQIADSVGITPQHAHNLHNSCLQKLRNYLTSRYGYQFQSST